MEKMVELVGGGSVINGPTPSSLYITSVPHFVPFIVTVLEENVWAQTCSNSNFRILRQRIWMEIKTRLTYQKLNYNQSMSFTSTNNLKEKKRKKINTLNSLSGMRKGKNVVNHNQMLSIWKQFSRLRKFIIQPALLWDEGALEIINQRLYKLHRNLE